MIIVKNRELLIPREEFNIGTTYDAESETRVFKLERMTAGGVDISNLTFRLDLKYANGAYDTAVLDKEYPEDDEPCKEKNETYIEGDDAPEDETKVIFIPPLPRPGHPHHLKRHAPKDYILLVLTIKKSMLQVPGTVLIQIRGLSADGNIKWTSFQGAFFVEEAINTPGNYTGDLTELEELSTKVSAVLSSEEARTAAEEKRIAAEAERAEAEKKRESDFTASIEEFEETKDELKGFAKEAESYAHGATGTRDGEDKDNARYYADTASEHETKTYGYMQEVMKYLNAVVPEFETSFNDGHLYYTGDSSYTFDISSADGDLYYQFKEA